MTIRQLSIDNMKMLSEIDKSHRQEALYEWRKLINNEPVVRNTTDLKSFCLGWLMHRWKFPYANDLLIAIQRANYFLAEPAEGFICDADLHSLDWKFHSKSCPECYAEKRK